MPENPWNSLEVAKLAVGILTPVSVVALSWLISRRLKKFEHIQWSNQKLIEKKLSLYDEISPLLNKLFCFYTWVGYWKEISPKDVIESKRSLDKTVNIYRHLLGEEFFNEYQSFISMLFVTYTGPGHDAGIRSLIKGPDGDRSMNCNYNWEKGWEAVFTDSSEVLPKQKVRAQYFVMMDAFKNSIGIQ
ncbi:MAG: hypothetical protein HZA16_12835 [Nitrospirae bacterium]|nr:hypothetical protein [Nitrospirota bacterium]